MKRLAFLAVLLLLAVSPAFAAHSVKLTWVASTDAQPGLTYNLYKAAGTIGAGNSVSCPATGTPAMTGWSSVTTGIQNGTLTYTDTTVTVGSADCYYATSTLNGLESVPSNTASAVILPAAPTSLIAIAQ